MSRGLGPKQRRLLAYAGRFRGEPVALVAEHLGVGERRARKVIESCRDADLVLVVSDPWTHDRRVFTPDAYRTWKWAQHRADSEREKAMLYPPRTDESGETAR